MTNEQKYTPITEERLGAITIESWKKWAEKYNAIVHQKSAVISIQQEKYGYVHLATIFNFNEENEYISYMLDWDAFVLLLDIKYQRIKYVHEYDYINQAKKIYELVDELEAV